MAGTLLFAGASLGAGLVPAYWAVLPLMLVAGAAWVAAISTFNVSAQRAAPGWVRSRVIASYQVTYMGSLAVGSVLWGLLADRVGAGGSSAPARAPAPSVPSMMP